MYSKYISYKRGGVNANVVVHLKNEMTKNQVEEKVNESEIANLRILLIALTVIQLAYLIFLFVDHEAYIKLIFNFHLDWIVLIINYIVAGIFLWYNWKKLPIEKKKKTDRTWMILFLGIIGMWLWIPNKSEIKKMNEKLHRIKPIRKAG